MGVGFTPLHLFVTCAEDIFFNYRETRGDAFVLRDLLDTSMLSLHHLLPAGFEKPEFRIAVCYTCFATRDEANFEERANRCMLQN